MPKKAMPIKPTSKRHESFIEATRKCTNADDLQKKSAEYLKKLKGDQFVAYREWLLQNFFMEIAVWEALYIEGERRKQFKKP